MLRARGLYVVAASMVVAVSGCGGGDESPPPASDGPLVGDGLEIEGVVGNVICAPRVLKIKNTAKSPRYVSVGTDAEPFNARFLLQPGAVGEVSLTVTTRTEPLTVRIESGLAFYTFEVRLRGERLELPASLTLTPAQLARGQTGIEIANTFDHTLFLAYGTTGELNTQVASRLTPGESVGFTLSLPGVPGTTKPPQGEIKARVEVTTGECERVTSTVDVTVLAK